MQRRKVRLADVLLDDLVALVDDVGRRRQLHIASGFGDDAGVDDGDLEGQLAAFGPGTDKGSIPTRAKPEIWAEQAKFKELNEKLVIETTKLAAAAKTGNADTLKAAFGATGAACKACHDNYQAKL